MELTFLWPIFEMLTCTERFWQGTLRYADPACGPLTRGVLARRGDGEASRREAERARPGAFLTYSSNNLSFQVLGNYLSLPQTWSQVLQGKGLTAEFLKCYVVTWRTLKMQIPGLISWDSDSVGLGWGPVICVFNMHSPSYSHANNLLSWLCDWSSKPGPTRSK